MADVAIRFIGDARSAVVASDQTAAGLTRVGKASKATNAAIGEQALVVGRSAKAHDEHAHSLQRSERGALAATGAFHGLGRSMAFASNAFLGGALIVGSLKSIIDATKNAQIAQDQLSLAFRNAGLSFAANRAQIDATEKTMRRLGFTNVETETALARLIVTTRNAGQAHKDLALAADLARFRHISLEAATQLVIKAQIGMTAGLRRLGIDVQNHTKNLDALKAAHQAAADAAKAHGEKLAPLSKAQIDAAKQADKHANSLAALAKLHQITADAAERYSHTAAGAADRLKASAEQLAVALGQSLLPAISHVLDKLATWVTKLSESKRVHDDVKQGVHALTGAFKAIEPVIVAVAKGLNAIVKATTGWKVAFELIIGGLLANKFLNLAKAIAKSRLAMLLLGFTAKTTGETVVASEAAMGAGATTLAGRFAAVRLAILSWLGPIGAVAGALYVAYKAYQKFSPAGIAPDVRRGPNPYPMGTSDYYEWQAGQSGVKAGSTVKLPGGGTMTAGGAAYQAGRRSGTSTPGGPAGALGPTSAAGGGIAGTAEWASRQPGAASSYRFGGTPGIGAGTHTDCSGFVVAVLERNGIHPPGRDTRALWSGGKPVAKNQLQSGDVVFFFYPDPKDNTPPNHVGIYDGGGYYIGDQHTGSGIVRAPMDWSAYYGARRYGAAGSPVGGGGGGAAAAGAGTGSAYTAPTSWGTTPGRAHAHAAQTLAQQKAAVRTSVAGVSATISQDAGLLGPELTKQLRAEVAAVNAELEKAGKADMSKVRANLAKVKADLAEALAQATDVKNVRGMLKTLNDDLKNHLIEPGIEAPIATRLKRLEALLRDHLLSPAQRKAIEDQIKAAGKAIQEALKQALDVKGIDTFLSDAINKIRDALGIGLKQLATPEQIAALTNRIHQIRDLLTGGLLSPAGRVKLEGELKADEATLTKGLDGLISQIADAKTRFDTAWGDFKQGILDAFSAIQNPFTAAETFATAEMGHYHAVTSAAKAESAIAKAAKGDPQAAQAAKLVHGLADAWREYYAAIQSGDQGRISAATKSVEDAQGALDAFASDPGGLSTAAQSVITNGQTVIDSIKYLGDEVLNASKSAWDEKHKADLKAITDGLDDIAKKIRDGKETPAQAWDEVVQLLIQHGFTPAQAEQMAGPLLQTTSDIGGAIHDLITAINNLVQALEGLSKAPPSSSWLDGFRAALKGATVDAIALHNAIKNLPGGPAAAAGAITSAGGIPVPGGGGGGGSVSPGTGGGCFAAGTPVAVPGGARPIEAFQVGDELLVWDFGRKQPVISAVEEVQRHEKDERDVLSIGLSTGLELETTSEHPFFTSEGWLPAGQLTLGSAVAVRVGEQLELTRVSRLVRGEKKAVYNLHVEHPDHNYFAAGCLVHNVKVLQHGGPVLGVDEGYDSVPALLRPGEFVLNQGAVRALGGVGPIQALLGRLSPSSVRGPIHTGPLPPIISSLSDALRGGSGFSSQSIDLGGLHLTFTGDVHGKPQDYADALARRLAVPIRDQMIAQIGRFNADIFGGMA